MTRPFLLFVALATASAAVAGPIPAAPPLSDEPLPESALMRFGTTRFRAAQQTFLSFSSDGRYLASGGYDGHMRIWEVPSGKELKAIPFQYNQVTSLRFSPDGKLLAGGSADGLIRVFSAGDWTERSPPPPPNRTWDQPFFDWLPDSKSLVRIGRDGKLRIQEAVSGRELQSWQVGQVNIATVACRPDGKFVFTQGYDHLLRVWDLSNGQEVKTFEVPENSARVYRNYPRLHFSADGKTLAATENERTVLIWNAETGRIARRLEVQGYFQSLALAPHGRTVATSAGDGTIRLWGIASGRELRVFDTPRESSTGLVFSPDGKHLVSSGTAALRFWDIENDRELYAERGHRAAVSGLAFLNGGQRLVSSSHDATFRFWNCATGAEIDRLSTTQYYYGSSLAAAGDGRSVLFSSGTLGVQRWTPEQGSVQYVGLSTTGGVVPTLSPDGQSAVAISGSSYRIYDVASGRESRVIEAPERLTNTHALSNGGRYFAAAHGYRDQFSAAQVSVYHVATGRRWRPLVPPLAQPMPAQRLVFSPDTRFLAVVYSAGEVRVWELATGLTRLLLPAETRQPNEPYRNPSTAVFSPDGRCLILGSASGQLVVCDLDRGVPLRIDAHRSAIQILVCSNDGERLATGSSDTSVLLWDLRKLRERAPHRSPLAVAPSTEELEHAWNMLGTTDEKAVGEALWVLSQKSSSTVPFFRDKLEPVQAPTAEEISRWVKQLGEARYATREKATRELSAAGENARSALLQALAAPPTHMEARRRLEHLLRQLDDGLTAVKLQPLRAVEVLERLGTPEARETLDDLYRRSSDVVVKEEIDRTLQRMKK